MKIGIIGAGFTGLSAAYYLQKNGHRVTIFERDESPGGLALGYKEKGWDWTLEQHYHHWFTNDKSVLELAKAINHKVIIKRPKTSSFVENAIYQLDSPLSLLRFPKLTFVERVRTGIALALLKYNPIWKPLERYRAEPYLKKFMGNKSYKTIWEPLMVNKLGKYASTVSLAWFWARIYKRTPSLAYPEGGFLSFANHLEHKLINGKVTIYHKAEVLKIDGGDNPTVTVKVKGKTKKEFFDKIIVTLPSPLFIKIAPSLPEKYIESLTRLKGIGAINLVLRLSRPFLNDGTYWLNMCDIKSPILAIVEHTNFMDKKKYNEEHLLYVGNYNPVEDEKFSMDENGLLNLYDPYLEKISPGYKKTIIGKKVFKAPFAQPIIPPNYSKNIPSFKTPLPNVYLANIQQVYPWDRGTNYAVELGKKIAALIENEE
jgi:protoporphyrinogen oxidase